MTEPIFLEKRFSLKIGEIGQKSEFLNLKKKVVLNFHRIFSAMEIFIIYCVPAQIL